MSIFIAELAFPPGRNLETSKIGILIGSGIAAIAAYGLGRPLLPASSAMGDDAGAQPATPS